jgi:uncharacterized Ntn-hydrolase superfamily protein
MGGAGTSCLNGDDVYVIYRAVPGRGVVHAQAYYFAKGRDRAAELLDDGTPPTDIIKQITLPSFDDNVVLRQYGIVDLSGRTAGFTGSSTTPFARDRQGVAGTFAYSVQGNILTSGKVLDHAASAFEQMGCDLPERLMNALEAGARGDEGDSRCTGKGIPADSAFLQVESPTGAAGSYLSLRVQTSGEQNPLPLLRSKLDAWRMQHPCQMLTPIEVTANDTEAGDGGGCSCRAVAANSSGALGWLFGGLLVVAWRRRAARHVRPAKPAR